LLKKTFSKWGRVDWGKLTMCEGVVARQRRQCPLTSTKQRQEKSDCFLIRQDLFPTLNGNSVGFKLLMTLPIHGFCEQRRTKKGMVESFERAITKLRALKLEPEVLATTLVNMNDMISLCDHFRYGFDAT
jgi:hypothetical protein